MESLGNPQTWVPYENVKDCSQGFCSLYCPQWCYIVLPPPPPYRLPDEASNTNFSTLFIVIISVLATVFLIGSYYAIISNFCGIFNWWRGGRRRNGYSNSIEEHNESHSPNQQPSQVTVTGLDDASIKSIKSFKYNKGNGFIEGTDCPVCLGEFQEDESLRLLPKCSHAFHLSCIDTWLKSQSNCPLCRASVFCTSYQESLPNLTFSQENQIESHTIVSLRDLDQRAGDEIVASNDIIPKNSSQDLWAQLESLEQSDVVIEIGVKGGQAIRRSVSMDLSSCSSHVSIGDILRMNQDEEEYKREEWWQRAGLGSSSKQRAGDHSTFSKNRRKVSDFVTSLGEMKRSFSSGRFVVF